MTQPIETEEDTLKELYKAKKILDKAIDPISIDMLDENRVKDWLENCRKSNSHVGLNKKRYK